MAVDLLDGIRRKVRQGEYEYSKHAVDQSILRGITVREIEEAVASEAAEVVEDYPKDKYGPSCLVLGFTKAARPLHLQCSHPARTLVKVITVYEPVPALWLDHRIRKKA